VTVSLVLPLAGGLSDIFGRRYFFLVGCFFSLIGTVVALTAGTTKAVIAGKNMTFGHFGELGH
jgi:MFS family permease